MGEVTKSNLALEASLVKKIIDRIDLKVVTAIDTHARNQWCVCGAYLSFSYVLSLRGNEGFMIDIKELIRHFEVKKGLVWIVLSGMVKGQKTPTLHYLQSVPVTGSGINIKRWRDRLVFIHQEASRIEGPAICDDDGFLMSNAAMNDLFWTILEELYVEDKDDFP